MIAILFEPNNHRFAAYDGDTLAGVCSFRMENNTWIADHTEVFPEFRGKGVAQQLVEALLAEAKEKGITIVPECSYVARIIEHKQHAEEV